MKRLLCLLIVCATVLLCGCQTENRETVFAMDTVMDLQVWGADSAKAVEELKSLIQETENTWSAYKEDSVIGKLNRGEYVGEYARHPLLDRAYSFSNRTDGAYYPKLYSAMQLWGFGTNRPYNPPEHELEKARKNLKWDLGGIIKGYTGQLAAEKLQKMDVNRAILNLGGNIQTYGNKPNGEPWSIGIQNPDGGDPVAVVLVNGTISVVTSGDYQRYFEIEGVRYHHILDPHTLRPADSGLRSVTVICADGTTADALSTALFVMGMEEGIRLWRESDDFEAVFLTEDGKIYATEGVTITDCEYEVIRREN